MPMLSWCSSLWRNISRKQRVESDLDAEMQSYLTMVAERNMESGMPPDQAWREARIAMGGVEQVKEQVRTVRAGFFLETVWQDTRCGARSLMKSRSLATMAVILLALGIGLNGAIFSAVNAVFLRPLPYHEPDRLVYVAQTQGNSPGPSGLSPADYLDWRERNRVFESMAVYDRINTRQSVATPGWSGIVDGYYVSAEFFTVLGVHPVIGRTFLPEEDRPGSDVVVLGHRLWRRLFASDPDAIGTKITVNGRSLKVIGVMGERLRYYQSSGFRLREGAEPDIALWLPYAFEHNPPSNRQYYLNSAIARLRPGVSIAQARSEMQALGKQLALEHPKENKDRGVWLDSLTEFISGPSRSSLMLAWSAMGLVLLIACANVAGLLLLRADSRRHEMAVRLSIGAGRSRIARQVVTENLLIGLAGGSAGVVVAWCGKEVLDLILPRATEIHRLGEATIDIRVAGFLVLLSLIVGLMSGLPAAIRGSRVAVAGAIQESKRGLSEGRHGIRTRGALVVLQVMLSMVLLMGAGLMMHSLWKLHQIRLGFEPENLLTFQSRLAVGEPYAADLGLRQLFPGLPTQQKFWALTPRAIQFPDRLAERLRSIRGVETVAIASGAPMIRTAGKSFQIPGRPEPSRGDAGRMEGPLWRVTPHYFQAIGTPLLQGRDFQSSDTASSPRVVIVNRTMATTYWPGESPVGKSIMLFDGWTRQSHEIVAVAEDVRAWASQEPGPQMYAPLSQDVDSAYANNWARFRLNFYCLIRSGMPPASLAELVRQAVQDVEKDAPIEKLLTMDQVLDENFGPWRSTMMLMTFTGCLSLVLTVIGIYGTISYTAAQRTNEIGIRMAVGANGSQVIWLVMKRGVTLMLLGVLAGSLASRWAVRFIESQLFDVKVMDPLAVGGTVAMLLTAGVLACYLPARRSSRIDPMSALRWE